MNRWNLEPRGSSSEALLPNEGLIHSQPGVRLDDGDIKVFNSTGMLTLTSFRLIWHSPEAYSQKQLTLHLSLIQRVDEEPAKLVKGERLVLQLNPPSPNQHLSFQSNGHCVKCVFKSGGQKLFKEKLLGAIRDKLWVPKPVAIQHRSGIGGIEKSIQIKAKITDQAISKAFTDLDRLMNSAKPMVELANTISRKIREKQGEISDDETVRFKSYLMSLGIGDPVTRAAHGTDEAYHKQLAKEIFRILETPVQEQGGMITMTDAYCRVNRARGMDLISPEDLLNACNTFVVANIPMKIHTFESTGVSVIQMISAELCAPEILEATETAVAEAGSLTAEELARRAGLAVVLAKERLLAAESRGRICRDDSVEGLKFYPNLFLTEILS